MDKVILPSKKDVRFAGTILRAENSTDEDLRRAIAILSQWRQVHFYPINTFQAYFRKLISNEYPKALVAQRLKRMPAIIQKLRRFPQMHLDRMQDIAGCRIIVQELKDVYTLHEQCLRSRRRKHEPVLPPKNYITHPKGDGYRSLHQVFKYKNTTHPELNGLRIEIQIRTFLQHSWATAVETLGIVEKSSFKTGEGDAQFKEFFKLSSDLFAMHEKTYKLQSPSDYQMFFHTLETLEADLKISQKLSGLVLSAKHIETVSRDSSGYHLVTLDFLANKLNIIPFTDKQFENAEALYTLVEGNAKNNPDMVVVLISAGNLADMKKAYPNYFLDTKQFIGKLRTIKESMKRKLL